MIEFQPIIKRGKEEETLPTPKENPKQETVVVSSPPERDFIFQSPSKTLKVQEHISGIIKSTDPVNQLNTTGSYGHMFFYHELAKMGLKKR